MKAGDEGNTRLINVTRFFDDTLLNDFANVDFGYSRHSNDHIGSHGGPCDSLHQLKQKQWMKARIDERPRYVIQLQRRRFF